MKNLCVKADVKGIKSLPGEIKKLESLTMPIRVKWVKDMKPRRLPAKVFLGTALQFIAEK